MLVRNWMTREVVTISPEESVLRAQEMMGERGIRRLPVVRGGKLVGIISQGDVQEAVPSDVAGDLWELDYLHPLAKIAVAEVMTGDPLTVRPEATIDEAALAMRENRVGGLPVLEEGELVGIITELDLFDAMIEIMGFKWGGTRIAIEVEDQPGALVKVFGPIKEQGANIVSIATCREICTAAPTREVVIRLEASNADTDRIVSQLKEQGIKILDIRRSA